MGSSQPESPFRNIREYNILFKKKILGAPDEYINRWDLLTLLYKYNRGHEPNYHLILRDPLADDIKFLAELKQVNIEAMLDVAEPLRVPRSEAEMRDADMLQEKMQTYSISSDAGGDFGPPHWLGLEGFEPETLAWLSKHSIDAESPIDEQAIEEADPKWAHALNGLELLKDLTVALLTAYHCKVVGAGAVVDLRILDATHQILVHAKGKGKQDDMDVDSDPFLQTPAPGRNVEVVELILHLLQGYVKGTQRMEIEISQDLVEAARRVVACAERTGEATDGDKSSLVKALHDVITKQNERNRSYSERLWYDLLMDVSDKSGIALECLGEAMKWVMVLLPKATPDSKPTKNVTSAEEVLADAPDAQEHKKQDADVYCCCYQKNTQENSGDQLSQRNERGFDKALLQQAATKFLNQARGKRNSREARESFLAFMKALPIGFRCFDGILQAYEQSFEGEGFPKAAEAEDYVRLHKLMLGLARQFVEQHKAGDASSSRDIPDPQAQGGPEGETTVGTVRSIEVVEDTSAPETSWKGTIIVHLD